MFSKLECLSQDEGYFDVELIFPAVRIYAGFMESTQGTAVRSTDLSLADSGSIYNGVISCARLFDNERVACDREL